MKPGLRMALVPDRRSKPDGERKTQAERNSSQIRRVLLDSVGLDLAGSSQTVSGSPTKPGKARFILARLAQPLVCSLFGSKFKALKTPPSHGLTGFVAIKVVAKWVVEMGGFREG